MFGADGAGDSRRKTIALLSPYIRQDIESVQFPRESVTTSQRYACSALKHSVCIAGYKLDIIKNDIN